jgi:hypothetical protein
LHETKKAQTMNTVTTVFLSGLIPLIVGFIWYNPKVFGNAWMRAAGLTEERMKSGNMAVIFIVTYALGCLISLMMMAVVIHQSHVYSIFADAPDAADVVKDFMAQYGEKFRTFKHGAFHGVLSALLFVTPIIAINALFERRGFRYIALHAGFWIISLALIGGMMCQFAMRG